MKGAALIWRNARQAMRELERIEKKRIKAAEGALRGEGYRLHKELKKEIRAGAPGGQQFSPLSGMAKKIGRRRKPLTKLSPAIKYRATKTAGKFNVEVGFVDPGRGSPLSRSWKRIARKQQEGFTSGVSWRQRSFFRAAGLRLSKRSKLRRYLLLRRSTRQLKTPARGIIDPFWRAHRSEAQRNIVKNWERKMSGERI